MFSFCQIQYNFNITTEYLDKQDDHAPLSLFFEYFIILKTDKFQVTEHIGCTILINIKVYAENISMVGTGDSRIKVPEFW